MKLTVLDDDEVLLRTLQRRLTAAGHQVRTYATPPALAELVAEPADAWLLDLRYGDVSGLNYVAPLRQHFQDCRILVLTGFASIATAVEAIKLGAGHYLAKPSNTDDIEAAFALQEGNTEVELTNRSSSIKTLEWERIHEVLAESDFNISEAARRLGMHRRTLSRKLGKQRV